MKTWSRYALVCFVCLSSWINNIFFFTARRITVVFFPRHSERTSWIPHFRCCNYYRSHPISVGEEGSGDWISPRAELWWSQYNEWPYEWSPQWTEGRGEFHTSKQSENLKFWLYFSLSHTHTLTHTYLSNTLLAQRQVDMREVSVSLLLASISLRAVSHFHLL